MREYEERGIGLAYCKKHYFQAHTHCQLNTLHWHRKAGRKKREKNERVYLSNEFCIWFAKFFLVLLTQLIFDLTECLKLYKTLEFENHEIFGSFWSIPKLPNIVHSFRSRVKEPILHLECNLLKHHQFRFTSSIFLAPSPKPIHLKMAQRKKNPKEGGGRVGTRAFPDFCMREEATKLWYLQFNREEGGVATFIIKMHHPVISTETFFSFFSIFWKEEALLRSKFSITNPRRRCDNGWRSPTRNEIEQQVRHRAQFPLLSSLLNKSMQDTTFFPALGSQTSKAFTG